MRIDILTIFPEAFESYFKASIIKRAQAKEILKINVFNLRKWAQDKRQTIDDRPYGGGAGMIFMVEPIFKALRFLKKKQKPRRSRVILFSLRGKKLTQNTAKRLKRFEQLILICPHYEGIDERVARHLADEEISIGDYVLTGGELPAMVLVDAVTRLLPGVIKEKSLKEESLSLPGSGGYEYPQYTRPEIFYPDPKNKKQIWRVPKILLSGNHRKIQEWRNRHIANK